MATQQFSLEAMTHPRNVGWGEIGLDYHYDNSPRDVQRDVFSWQLRHAVRLGKPITVHTREADDDTERILKAEVPKDHKVGSVRRYRLEHYALTFLWRTADTRTLLHRLARFRSAFVGPLSEPVHRHHGYSSFCLLSGPDVHD